MSLGLTFEDYNLRYCDEPEEAAWELEMLREKCDVALVPIVDIRPSVDVEEAEAA